MAIDQAEEQKLEQLMTQAVEGKGTWAAVAVEMNAYQGTGTALDPNLGDTASAAVQAVNNAEMQKLGYPALLIHQRSDGTVRDVVDKVHTHCYNWQNKGIQSNIGTGSFSAVD